MKLNRQPAGPEEEELNVSKLTTAKPDVKKWQVPLKKSDFLSKRQPVASRQHQLDQSFLSGHRDSSSTHSLSKNRRGRSHRKSRKQSQEGFHPSSNERKNKITNYSDILNRSIDEAGASIQKPNVIVLQKELVNRSNQKMFDLANCTEQDAAELDQLASNRERNDSFEEFNKSAEANLRVNEVIYKNSRKDLFDTGLAKLNQDYEMKAMLSNQGHDPAPRTEQKKMHHLIQEACERADNFYSKQPSVIYNYQLQEEICHKNGGGGTPSAQSMTSPLLPGRMQNMIPSNNFSTLAHLQSEKDLLLTDEGNFFQLSLPKADLQPKPHAPVAAAFSINFQEEKQKMMSGSKSFKTVFKLSQSGQKHAQTNEDRDQYWANNHQEQSNKLEQQLKVKLQNYNSYCKENSLAFQDQRQLFQSQQQFGMVPQLSQASDKMQVSKFQLPYDSNPRGQPQVSNQMNKGQKQSPIYQSSFDQFVQNSDSKSVQQIKPRNDCQPAMSFLKEVSMQGGYQPDSSHLSRYEKLMSFDDSKYKNKYFMMPSATSGVQEQADLRQHQKQNIMQDDHEQQSQDPYSIQRKATDFKTFDPESPRFTDLLKMSGSEDKNSKNLGIMFRTHDQAPGSRMTKSNTALIETGGLRDRSARSRKSIKSGKSNCANSHKSGKKKKKAKQRQTDQKCVAKGHNEVVAGDSIEIDSLDFQEYSIDKDRPENVDGKVHLSMEKYGVIENMNTFVNRAESYGDLFEMQKQPINSQQMLMNILESPNKSEIGVSEQRPLTNHFEKQQNFKTFQNHIRTIEQQSYDCSQMISEQDSESRSSIKTPYSKKAIKDKSSLKSKKKKKSKQKSEKKCNYKDDQSIKQKKQNLKMFISAQFSNTQKMTKQIRDYHIQANGDNFEDNHKSLEEEFNQLKYADDPIQPISGPMEELETFREAFNEDTQMERSASGFHDQTYESLIIKKPQDSFPFKSEENDLQIAQTISQDTLQPAMKEIQTEPNQYMQNDELNAKLNHLKASLQNYSDQKVLRLSKLGDGSNNSEFGSSDGTNLQQICPAKIHELVSPGYSNFGNTNFLNSAVQSTKNFQYLGKRDLLAEDSRNETNFFMRTAKVKTSNNSNRKKDAKAGTQKFSFKRSYNCSINEEIQVKSVTSTPGKVTKSKLKKHRQSCFEEGNKTSPILRDHLRLMKDDSVSAPRIKVGPQTTTNAGKSKRYQTMRTHEYVGHVSKSLTNKRHLQSTHIIKQMKQSVKENGRAISGIRKVNPYSVSSPSHAKNVKKPTSNIDVIENTFDDHSCKLQQQYSKVISVKEGDMNNRTFSGPIVYQMNQDADGQSQHLNDSLSRQNHEQKKSVLKNELQPASIKSYMKIGKSSQTPHQAVNLKSIKSHQGESTGKSSKLLQNQQFNVQSTSSSTMLSTKTPNKAAIYKLFNTQTDEVIVSNRLAHGHSSKNNINLYQSSRGSTSTEHDYKAGKVKALSLDRQCAQPLASLENIKEQVDDEMDFKQEYTEDDQQSSSPRSKENQKPSFAEDDCRQGEDCQDDESIRKAKKPVSFTERNTQQNKSPFDGDLSHGENQPEELSVLSPEQKNDTNSKSKMKEKQKSLHSLITSKNMMNTRIEYTQRMLNSSQMVQNPRNMWRNKRISHGNCFNDGSQNHTGDDQLKLNPSKTYNFQKSLMGQQAAQRQPVSAYQNQGSKVTGNKSSGFCPPSLREMLKPKGTNLSNINSIRSSKNTSAQNTAKVAREPESAMTKAKAKDVGLKKSEFISSSYISHHDSKKGSGSKKLKSVSKRELLSMSVLSESRNANQTSGQGNPLKDDANEPPSSLRKSERRAHNLLNSSAILQNSTLRKQDTSRIPNEKLLSNIERKVSQENLHRNKKQAMNIHKQKTTAERIRSPLKHSDRPKGNEYRDMVPAECHATKRPKPAASIGRQDRQLSNLKAFKSIMKDSRESQRQHYSNLYSNKQSLIEAKENKVNKPMSAKESKEEEILQQRQIQNGKQNNITERKLYYQLQQQKNSDHKKQKRSISLDKQSVDSKREQEINLEEDGSAKMNKHSKTKKGSTQFKRKQSLVHQSRGTPHQNITLSKSNIGEFDPYQGLSGRNSRDQQIRTPGQMQYLVTGGGRNSLTKELSKDIQSMQGVVAQTPSTAPAAILNGSKVIPHSERQPNNNNKSSKASTGMHDLNDLEQSFEIQQQQTMNQLKSKKQQNQLQNYQKMDKSLIDQFIPVSSALSTQQASRGKAQVVKQKAITQPIASNFSREPIFQSHLVSNGSVPAHLEEWILKEAAGLNEHRGSQKMAAGAGGFNNLYTHKILAENHLSNSTATYVSNGGNVLGHQMKAQMVKKANRGDNASIGPTSKFKSTAKTNNLSSNGNNNIRTVYGIGGGGACGLTSSNQNVQMRSQFQGTVQKLNSTSMVRQKTDLAVNNSVIGHSQKTPITQMQGHTPVSLGQNLNMMGGASQGNAKDKKQSFAALLQPYEKEKFGDRCPLGFKKKGLLGKGGIALVWLAEIREHRRYGYSEDMIGMRVALKQFPKIKGMPIDNSAKIEIETGNTLFPLEIKEGTEGEKDEDFVRGFAVDEKEHPGIKSIARLIDQIEDSKDVWLVYEVGAQCLAKQLCEVKGEFYKGERIYRISHQDFYQIMLYNNNILRTLIVKIAEAFDVLSRFGIVHSDIKPDNILIQLNRDQTDIEQIKLIDFGSAFQFHNVTQISATTPEYLAPEILNYLEDRNKNSKSVQTAVSLSQKSWPWSFDVWSLGIILLEIVTGCPVWMSLKCRMQTVDGKSVIGTGLLGVAQRDQKKILMKQQQLLKSIPSVLRKFECYGLDRDAAFMDLLHQMLTPDPSKRISPADIINHPFCQNRT